MEAKVKALARIAVVTVTLAALVAGAPAAGADTTWTKISTDYNANIVVPSLGLIGTTAVVAWTQQTGPLTADIDTVSFTTSPTQDVIGAASSEGRAGLGVARLHARAVPASRRRPLAGVLTAFTRPDRATR